MGGNPTLEEFGKNFPSFQFVVLYHQFSLDSNRKSHWDLLLEQPSPENTQLLTFEVSAPPQDWEKTTRVRQLPNHRSIYLTYEGPIAGNRGIVSQVLKGDIQWRTRTENSLVLNLRFQWEKQNENPPVYAVLMLTKVAIEGDRVWDLKLEI